MNFWKKYELQELVFLGKEKYNPQKDDRSYKCIELEHLSSGSGRLLGYTDSLNQQSIKNKFTPGDVLFGKLRPYLRKYYLPEFEGVCSSEIWVLKGKNEKLKNKYLYYLIQSNRFLQNANKSSGSKMPRADWNYLSELIFTIPSLNEQEKITNILSTWDKAIELKEKLIEQKKEQKKGLMQRLLTGKIRLEGFKEPWEKVQLGKIATIVMGQSPKSDSYNELEEGIPLIQGNADIKNRRTLPRNWTTNPTKICHPNDILMTVRAPVGSIALSEHEACLGRGVCAIQANINSDYLYYQLIRRENMWGKIAQGSTFESINSNDIKELIIEVPIQEEQIAIAKVLKVADKHLSLLKRELEELYSQKQALMQQLLTGKIRVKV